MRDVAGRGLVATLATEMHNMRMHTSRVSRVLLPPLQFRRMLISC